MMPHPDLIKIYPYSSAWPEWFAAEREVLEVVFSSANVQIEHIGSTAVPGLGAKPIIDILLGAPSLPVIEAKIPALLTLELTRQSFSKSYRDEVIAKLQSLSPAGFERFCQRLLRESGFQEVSITGRSGDGGIDGIGILQVNTLVSFKCCFSAKNTKELFRRCRSVISEGP
jgi:GrpB-like predicted nucleotidyltransferase (UPF0157 family)